VSPIPQIARNRFEVAAGNLVSATEASYRAGRLGGSVRIRAPGAEPAERDFKTVALNRSAIPPRCIYLS